MTPSGFLLVLAPGAMGANADWLETGSPQVTEALQRLVDGVTEAELVGSVRSGGLTAIASIHFCLQRLRDRGLLHYRVPLGASCVRVRPLRRDFRLEEAFPNPKLQWVLSRFACLRRAEGGVLLESGAAPASLLFEDPENAAGILRFCEPRRFEPETLSLIKLLVATGLLQPADEAERASLQTWEFHDLLFHSRSSADDSGRPRGRTERFQGQLPQPPSMKPMPPGRRIPLPQPDAKALWSSDPPLALVSDTRRSIRTSGAAPITLSQLAELLWRVDRLPAAGGLNELEFYAAVDGCNGLDRGLYCYSSEMHELIQLGLSTAFESLLLAAAARLGPKGEKPQVVIVVAARFARMAWSYEAIAYRNVLLDAGIALHALYLAATAMKLGPCAIGWNHPVLFAAAAGLDPLEESSVALFAVSSSGAG